MTTFKKFDYKAPTEVKPTATTAGSTAFSDGEPPYRLDGSTEVNPAWLEKYPDSFVAKMRRRGVEP